MIHVVPFDPVRNVDQLRWLERRLGFAEGDLDLGPIGPLPDSVKSLFASKPPGVKDPATRSPSDLPEPMPPIVHPVNPYRVPGAPLSPDPVEAPPPEPEPKKESPHAPYGPKRPTHDTDEVWPPSAPPGVPKRRK